MDLNVETKSVVKLEAEAGKAALSSHSTACEAGRCSTLAARACARGLV